MSAIVAPSEHWLAVRVRPNFEQTVTRALLSKGLEAFLPSFAERHAWSDRIKTIDVPLFPQYLFCRAANDQRLSILTTPAVRDIVGFGKTPALIPNEEILAVQRFVASGLPIQRWPYVTCGQTIFIEKGPLAGLEGIITNVKGAARVVVSISLLQRSVAADIDIRWIRPVSSVKPVGLAS
jgi:transcription antitermination factor NusG